MTDFPVAEYEARLARAQAAMAMAGIDALFLNTEAELNWFTGFRTAFWQSPTRRWYLVVPRDGLPTALVPRIGAALMRDGFVGDVLAFDAPAGGNEGLGELTALLRPHARIATPMGEEASLRMALAEFDALRAALGAEWVDASPLLKRLQMIKSPAEIAVLREICTIGSRAFARLPELVGAGQTLEGAFRAFRIALLEEGAEDVPYLVGGAGPNGYVDVISPASTRALVAGDVLMLDTGARLGGYFCDFDRNVAIGRASEAACRAHETLWRATEAGLAAARPGTRACDLFHAMAGVLGTGSDIGRLGHGLGLRLTEWPSLAPHDTTVLAPGMVLTLEPSVMVADGAMMVTEENILITDGAPELLTRRAERELPVI